MTLTNIDFAAEPIVLAHPDERAREKANAPYDERIIRSWERREHRADLETSELDGSPSWGSMPRWPKGKPDAKPGDRIRVYNRGSVIGGIDLLVDGEWVEIFFQTESEREAEHGAWVAAHQQDQRRRFEESKTYLDELYEQLPAPLKRRIDRFRAEDSDFRWRSESYEMAACSEAGRLYKRAMDPEWGKALKAGGWKAPKPEVLAAKKPSYEWEPEDGTADWEDTPEMRLRCFDAINSKLNDYQYKAMDELMPEMDRGHSGNTWGFAFVMALALIRDGDDAKL